MKKYLNITFVILLLLFAAGQSYSQPVPQWISRYNGLLDSTDVSKDIVVDNAGNTYVTGYSYEFLGLLTSAVTISYDPAGNLRWRKEYDQPLSLTNDGGNAIVLDNTQQYVYIAGFTNSVLGLISGDYLIVKYRASDGQLMWARTYNGGLLCGDAATSIAMDSQNNPVITGFSQRFLLFLLPYDYATVKYDQNGNQQWASRYNGPDNNEDRAYAIVVDNADNIIVTGESMGSGTDFDYATVKYNPSGTQMWSGRYNGPGNNEDRAYAIVVDNSDNVIVTGESMGSSSGFDYATVKYDPAGNQQWAGRYNGPGNNEDRAYAIVVDNSDNPVVTGSSKPNGNQNSEDYATVKYNSSGSQQWVSTYNGPGNSYDRAYAIVVDNSDNIFVTGTSRSSGSQGSEDYATLRYNPNGSQQWVTRYDGNNEDRAYAIVVDNLDNIYITGTSLSSSILGSDDYLTIKYADTELSGIHLVEGITPTVYSIYQNFPNPFNPSTKIKIDVAENSFVKLTVYDILGVEKEVLISSHFTPGTYEVEWNASKYTSGIYFYRVSMDGFSATRKMMLIK